MARRLTGLRRSLIAEEPERTRVELEHRQLDRLVDGQALRDGIGESGGWSSNLERFAEAMAREE